MINKCDVKEKFVVIRLTEDILMNEFSLINREFYSSNLKNFEVSFDFLNFHLIFFDF